MTGVVMEGTPERYAKRESAIGAPVTSAERPLTAGHDPSSRSPKAINLLVRGVGQVLDAAGNREGIAAARATDRDPAPQVHPGVRGEMNAHLGEPDEGHIVPLADVVRTNADASLPFRRDRGAVRRAPDERLALREHERIRAAVARGGIDRKSVV